jgi:HAD superfamily hydrolase (TIGR01509 family)
VRFAIFDMDGVLVDTCACHARAYRDLWDRCGVEGPPYAEIAGRPTAEVVAERLGSHPASRAELVAFKQGSARRYLRSEAVVFEDVRPVLDALDRSGVGMCVATGASRETAEMLLAQADIVRYFRFVLTAEDACAGKPDPEIYRSAVERAAVRAEHALVVEDSASGLEAAVAAGVPVACVRSGLTVDSPFFRGVFPTLREWARSLGLNP